MATNLLYNRYTVLEKLDEGGFGEVYKCWDHRNHKEMAFKKTDITLSIKEVQAYHEAVFLKVLKHDSIIRFEEDFVVGDYHYLVLDYISMGSLFDVLKANGAFTLSSVKKYAQSLMEVLAFLKKNSIVHGDLKLENILVQGHHTAAIRLADFGASFFDTEPPDHFFGTAGYQAPEVLLALPFGAAVDMWAAGCLLAEISVGKRLLPKTSTIQEVAGITKILGTPPLKMLHAAPNGHRYFYFFGQLTEECLQETPQCWPLKEFLKTRDPLFLDFISSILCWNPDDRLTPESALKQPWMSAAHPLPVRKSSSSSSRLAIPILPPKVSSVISLPPPAVIPIPFIQPSTDAFLASASVALSIGTILDVEMPTAPSSTSTTKCSIQVEDLNTAVSLTAPIADSLPESETIINVDIKPQDVEEFPVSIEAIDEMTQNGAKTTQNKAETIMGSILSLPINADYTVNPLLESESTVNADSKPYDAEQKQAMVQSDMNSAEKMQIPKSKSLIIRKRLRRFGRALIKLVCGCGRSGEGD